MKNIRGLNLLSKNVSLQNSLPYDDMHENTSRKLFGCKLFYWVSIQTIKGLTIWKKAFYWLTVYCGHSCVLCYRGSLRASVWMLAHDCNLTLRLESQVCFHYEVLTIFYFW